MEEHVHHAKPTNTNQNWVLLLALLVS